MTIVCFEESAKWRSGIPSSFCYGGHSLGDAGSQLQFTNATLLAPHVGPLSPCKVEKTSVGSPCMVIGVQG